VKTSLQIDREADVLVVRGEIDMAVEREFEEALRDAMSSGTTIVDLSGVSFIDSTGLGVLINIAVEMNGTGPLVVRRPSRAVRRVMQIALPTGAPGLEIR